LTGKPLINLFLYTEPNKIKCTNSTLIVIHVCDVLLQKMGKVAKVQCDVLLRKIRKVTEVHQVPTCAARSQQMSGKVSSIQ